MKHHITICDEYEWLLIETHTIKGYDFEELSNKVVAHAIIIKKENEV